MQQQYLLLLAGLACAATTSFAQTVSWEFLAPIPERITNQAVTAAEVDGETYIYSFAGIDSTLECSGDHLRAYRYSVSSDEWETIAALPDPLGGKIAPGASTVKGKVYIIGGYHLAVNCSETSSNRIHVFDPVTNSYEADGAFIPVPIDDQVQAVWRDSLIFVVTGWSNTGNVPDVQIYNPSTDEWLSGTSIPNTSTWKVFGGSGTIIGDTIYYAGGARSTGFFGPTSQFRKGYIHPEDPTIIDWEGYTEPLAKGYRMGATSFAGEPIWIGGSDDTYNFDALAYSGGSVVPPLNRISIYRPATGQMEHLFGLIPLIMDIRGVAELDNGEYVVVGGMLDNQEVTNSVLKITISDLTSTEGPLLDLGWKVFPNPSTGPLEIQFAEPLSEALRLELLDDLGRLLQAESLPLGRSTWQMNSKELPAGTYWLRLIDRQGNGSARQIQIVGE